MKHIIQLFLAILIFAGLVLLSVVSVSAAAPLPAGASEELLGSELPPDFFDEDCDGGPSCPGRVFTDMPPASHWAHVSIDWAITHHITSGTSSSTFSPDRGCTRAEAVTLLWRAKGSPEPESAECPFADVPENAFYYKAVLWAAENQITLGTSGTTFAPGKICTRAQIVTLLWRAFGSPGSSDPAAELPFRDVAAGAYYRDAVVWATGKGITRGTSSTAFSPDLTCTRAQIVTFLYRAIHG